METAWFDTQAGELLVDAAAEQRLEQSGPQVIVPLAQLIQTEPFPYTSGDFKPADTTGWQPEDYIQFGKWALAVMAQEGEARPVNRQHFKRLRILGLGPPLKHLGGVNGFNAYKDLIGAPLEGDIGRYRARFREAAFEDIIRQAGAVADQLGRKLTQSDYKKAVKRGEVPSEDFLYKKIGGLRRLNDLLGYPDISSWQEDDYIDFGLHFLRINGPDLFTPDAFEIIAKRQRGPWARQVTLTFPKWRTYKEEVLQIWFDQGTAPQQRLTGIHEDIRTGRLPREYVGLDKASLLCAAARYRVIEAVSPTMPAGIKERLALTGTPEHLVRTLQARHRHADQAYVEMVALSLDAFDDIWPALPQPAPPGLQITSEELETARAVRRAKEARLRARVMQPV